MDITLQNKISEYLKAERNQSIINSNEFYFQKAKSELQKFLDLEVGENERLLLIKKKKNYEELKKLFQDSEEFSEFGKTIFSLVSYCDLKAYKKNEFNQYDDKRVLAAAFVRMNNWLDQLITYKFEGQLSEGSVKNAMEYLLKPEDNFTMLSENHRSMISENLFKKSYNKSTFKQDFIDFFSKLSIRIENPVNYTHLLSCLSYDISAEWKESIIGLMSPDGTGWQQGAINDLNGADYIILWNHRKPNGTTKTFKLLKDCIDESGFFKIFYTSKNNAIYVAEVIDFVTSAQEYNKADWGNNYENINRELDSFDEYKDGDKSASWVYLVNRFYKIEPIPSSYFKYYFPSGYPSVGSQTPIISFTSNIEFKKSQNMKENIKLLQYKKQIILQGPPGTGKTRLAKEIAKQLIESNTFNTKTISVKTLTKSYIQSNLKVGQKIQGKNDTVFEILDLGKNVVLLKSETSKPWKPSYNKIIDSFNNKLWKIKGRTGGFKSYEDALAKYFYENHINSLSEEEQSLGDIKDFHKIIQFHPSYTYEDFVRGIVAKPNEEGEGIIYEEENKTLAKFAEDASNDFDNNYVLVIDEINRANLSSVLGELIYALEYRGKDVESMYEVNGSQKLILPPNLYIIGTMNTADRSVGHIDYAIRRRFAFVDVLPQKLQDDNEIYFNTNDFNKVSLLFNEANVSKEFEIDAVQIGHSYFIVRKKDVMNDEKRDELFKMRMKYEVKPILLEYVRDGILIGEYEGKKIKEYIKSL